MMPCPETAVFQSFGLTLNPLKARLRRGILDVQFWVLAQIGEVCSCFCCMSRLDSKTKTSRGASCAQWFPPLAFWVFVIVYSWNVIGMIEFNIYCMSKQDVILEYWKYGIGPSRRGTWSKIEYGHINSCIPFRMLIASQSVSLWMLAAVRFRCFSWNTIYIGGKIEPTNLASLSLSRSPIRAR